MLDEKRVIVERLQESLIRKLRDWGFTPIPCSFANDAPFGGSFHCATLDVRRRGETPVVLLSAGFSGEPPQNSHLGRIPGGPPRLSVTARGNEKPVWLDQFADFLNSVGFL